MTDAALAALSNNLVYATLVVLTLALMAFAADLAFGAGRVRASTAKARSTVSVAAGGASADGSRVDEAADTDGSDHDRYGRIGVALTALGFGLLLGAVVTRGLAVGRPPWGNMYEFSLAGALSALGVFLVLLLLGRQIRYLGVFVVLAALLTLGVAVVVLYTEAAQLVPALKSYWLWIHVTAAIISSGIFTVATAATLMFLIADGADRRAAAGRSGGWLAAVASHLPDAVGRGLGLVGGWLAAVASHLPDAKTSDRVAYRTIAFAFPLWFFTIMAGAIWAEDAWGRYWGWDPKETWSFVTLVLYAAYLHARATAGWKGRSAALVALAAYGCFLFNYFGVNIWFFGLHSYGGV